MIEYVNGSVLTDLPDYSVILHQCNAKGWMGAGLAKEIARKWPEAFNKYHAYCRWFSDGHEDEIMGTFCPVQINDKLIVCNAIAQKTVSRSQQMTDYAAWEKLCEKIERQTRLVNKKTGKTWTIHAPEKIGCGLGGGSLSIMTEIFERHFKDSPVKVVFHRY